MESLWSVRVVTVLFYALFHHFWIAYLFMFLPAPNSPQWRLFWHSSAVPYVSLRNVVCAVHASFAVLVALDAASWLLCKQPARKAPRLILYTVTIILCAGQAIAVYYVASL